MHHAKTRQDVGHVLARLAGQAFGLTLVAACAATGYLMFNLTTDSEFAGSIVGVFSAVGRVIGNLFNTNDRVMITVLPALVIAGLLLGGLYVWRKRS